jgi:hypothetical protein
MKVSDSVFNQLESTRCQTEWRTCFRLLAFPKWLFLRFHCTRPVPAPGLHNWIWKSSIEQSSTTSYFTRVVCNIPVFQGNASSLKQVLHSVWQRVGSQTAIITVFINKYQWSASTYHEDRDYHCSYKLRTL